MRSVKHARLGFTLLEVTISMTVATVLMGAMASAIVIAGHALPNPGSSLSARVNSFLVAEQMVGELYCAQGFSERTATAIEFTVADRDNDTNPETIRYEWLGTSSDPLTRQYNGGTVVDLIGSVYDFQLAYNLQTLAVETEGPTEVHPMQTAVSIPAISPEPNTGFLVSDATWCGMYFELDPATAPAGATSWTVKEIWFKIKATANGPGTGFTAAQLRAADPAGLPTATVLGEYLVDEDPLDTKFWTSKVWSGINVPSVPASEGLCVVFKPASGTETGQIRFQDTSGVSSAAYTTFLRSTDAGASWTPSANEALTQCTIYANITVGGTVETFRYFLTSIDLSIQASAEQSTRAHTSVEVLNKGEVAGG